MTADGIFNLRNLKSSPWTLQKPRLQDRSNGSWSWILQTLGSTESLQISRFTWSKSGVKNSPNPPYFTQCSAHTWKRAVWFPAGLTRIGLPQRRVILNRPCPKCVWSSVRADYNAIYFRKCYPLSLHLPADGLLRWRGVHFTFSDFQVCICIPEHTLDHLGWWFINIHKHVCVLGGHTS